MKKPPYETSEIVMAVLILFALVVAILTGVNLFTGKKAAQAKATAESTAAPSIVIATPTPTESGETATAVSGPRANSGGFMTQTGTSLNLIMNWYAEEAGEKVTVYVDVLLDCSTMRTASRVGGITLGVGSQTFTLDSAEVNTGMGAHTITLCSTHFDVPASDFVNGSCEAYATWYYGGTYGGQAIPELTAKGTISLD